MELFVGIHLPPPASRELARLQNELRRYDPSGRYEPVENFHLTLRYMGDQLPLCQAADRLERIRYPRFSLELGRLNMFENSDNNVVWVSVEGNEDSLHVLRSGIDKALLHAGFEADGLPFVPHISLAYGCRPAIAERFASCHVHSRPFEVSCFHLYQVDRGQSGVRFRKLRTFKLIGEEERK